MSITPSPTSKPVIVPLIPAHPRLRFMTEAAPGAAPAAPPAGQEQQPPAGQQQEPPKPPWGDDPTKFDPDKAWKLIQNLRTEAEERQTKTDAAIAQAVTDAAEKARKDTLTEFGRLLAGEEPVETDPVKLQAKVADLGTKITEATTNLTAAQGQIKAGELSLAVALLAPDLGASTKLLLANEQFKTSIASVEPTDEAAIKAAITKAVQDTPTLKATPPRSGSGEHQGATVQSLEAQLAEAQKNRDFTETIRLKRAIAAAKA